MPSMYVSRLKTAYNITIFSSWDYVQAVRAAQSDQWDNQIKKKDLEIGLRVKVCTKFKLQQ